MKTFNIEADTVTDVDLGDFALDAIQVTVYNDDTIELSQPELGEEAACIGLSIGQASSLYEILSNVIGGGVDEEEVAIIKELEAEGEPA